MKRELTMWITWYLVTVMFLFGITPKVEAGFSPSALHSQAQINRSGDVEKIRNFLEIKMVRERLHAYGFSQEEIQMKLNRLTDDQIHRVALQIDELQVGGNGGEVAIIVILVFILFVLLIYVTGHRIFVK